VLTSNHLADQHSKRQDQQNVNETTQGIGRGFSGDPKAEEENANQRHGINPF